MVRLPCVLRVLPRGILEPPGRANDRLLARRPEGAAASKIAALSVAVRRSSSSRQETAPNSSRVFMFRNWLAHTRPEIILYDAEHPMKDQEKCLYEAPRHKWEKYPFSATAERAIKDVEEVITLLNARSPYPEPMPMSLSWHSGGSSIDGDAFP